MMSEKALAELAALSKTAACAAAVNHWARIFLKSTEEMK